MVVGVINGCARFSDFFLALQNAAFCEESFGNSHANAHVICGRPTRQDVERFRKEVGPRIL